MVWFTIEKKLKYTKKKQERTFSFHTANEIGLWKANFVGSYSTKTKMAAYSIGCCKAKQRMRRDQDWTHLMGCSPEKKYTCQRANFVGCSLAFSWISSCLCLIGLRGPFNCLIGGWNKFQYILSRASCRFFPTGSFARTESVEEPTKLAPHFKKPANKRERSSFGVANKVGSTEEPTLLAAPLKSILFWVNTLSPLFKE